MEQSKGVSIKVQRYIELTKQKGDTVEERENLLRDMTIEEVHELCNIYIGDGNGSTTCKACLMTIYNSLHIEQHTL